MKNSFSPLRSGRRSPDMVLPCLVASSVGSARSSLAPTRDSFSPLRPGSNSKSCHVQPDMVLPCLVASSVGSAKQVAELPSSLAPTRGWC